jgi:hypothetical protein
MVSLESIRPSLSRDIGIVEFLILCLSGFRISGGIIKASGTFVKWGGVEQDFVFPSICSRFKKLFMMDFTDEIFNLWRFLYNFSELSFKEYSLFPDCIKVSSIKSVKK